MMWPANQGLAGKTVELVVYQDTDGDGDPSNAELMGTYNVSIGVADGATWDNYDLPASLLLRGPGDVLIGAIDREVDVRPLAELHERNAETHCQRGSLLRGRNVPEGHHPSTR